MREGFVGGVVLEQAALADDLLLLGEHLVHVVTAQPLILDDDLGEDVLGLAEGQSERRLQQAFASRVIQFNPHLFELLHILDDAVQQGGKILAGRQGMVEDGDFLLQFGGDFQRRRHEHDCFQAVLQVQRDVLELADHGEVAPGQEMDGNP